MNSKVAIPQFSGNLVNKIIEWFKSRDWHYLVYVCVIFLGYINSSSYEYLWRYNLGRVYLEDKSFSVGDCATWGTYGKTSFIDLDWLSNIIYYICNNDIAYYCIKVATFLILGFVLVKYLKTVCHPTKDNEFLYISVLVLLSMMTVVFDISIVGVIFGLVEVYLFEKYSVDSDFTKLTVLSSVVVVLWANFYMTTTYAYFLLLVPFLVKRLNIKYIYVCIFNLVCTGLNPNGYLALLDSIKEGLTLQNIYVMCFILLLGFVHISKTRLSMISYLCILVIYFISLTSVLSIFLVPFILGVIKNTDTSKIHFEFSYASVVIIIAVVVLITQLVSPFKVPSIRDKDLTYKLQVTNQDNTGLFTDDELVATIGIKPFISGVSSDMSKRQEVVALLTQYASTEQIEEVIDEYKLSKFFFKKASSVDGYTNCLYNYLYFNDNYIIIYDSDDYVYFISRDTYYTEDANTDAR